MKVVLKLFASLTDYLPPERKGNRVELDVVAGETVGALIARYQLPDKSVHLVLVNGVFIPPAKRLFQALTEGDELAIWPPIAGG
jgi:sulfur carrier protein ThiS